MKAKPTLKTVDGFAATLWFRENEMLALNLKKVFCSIRYGDRTETTVDPKGGYKVGSIIKLLIMKEDGNFADFESAVKISSVETKMMNNLSEHDFDGCPLGQRNKNELCTIFKKYYGEILCNQDLVSIIKFEYLN